MAGAMAVSAMAAVVSADQDAISLTYDLKTYVNNVNKNAAKVTVVANYEGSLINKASWDKHKDPDKGYVTFGVDNTFVTGGTIYTQSGVELGTVNAGAMKEFEFTARPYKDIPNDLEEKYQTFKATSKADNVDGAYYDKTLGGTSYDMPIAVGNNVYGAFDLTKYDLYTLGYSVAKNADAAGLPTVTETTYAVRDAVAKMTYEIPNTISMNKANGWGWIGDISNWSNTLTEAELEYAFREFFGTSFYGDVTMTAEVFAKGFWDAKGNKKGLIKPDTALASEPTTVAVGSFTAGSAEEAIIPFKSTLTPGKSVWTVTNADGSTKDIVTKENDVVWALENRKAGGNYYTKPIAVINDAIANHTNVTFTFTSYDGYVGTYKSHALNQWVNIDQGYGYQTSSFDWHNPTFGQHLYAPSLDNNLNHYSLFDSDDYDMYGSYSSAWGINLFTGAVVVNNAITMQLSDVDTFNWGSNTLTFDWFDITDDGKITDAKTFLTSMLLYTPVDWYWDKLTVVVTDEEREDIDAGAGLEDEPEVIEDEPEVVETEAETEAAPVEAAPSPATGNAPVALAVIPVALAAAAVVAKKRG
ncbi:MAG: hypothetical protein MSJ26_06020 [Oscillospiraceae bacterium]|nr:hypothetical protein [Oscillospiraceae bacterium]